VTLTKQMTEALEASQQFAKHLELTLFNMRTTLASKTEREHQLEAELASSLQRVAKLETQVRVAETQHRQQEKTMAMEQKAWDDDRLALLTKQEEMTETVRRLTEQQQQQQQGQSREEQRSSSESSTPETATNDKTTDAPVAEEAAPVQTIRSGSTNLFALQMLVQQKDRRIETLEEEIATLKHDLNLLRSGLDDNEGLLETQLIMLKQEYAKLLDDVEGYQTLLQDRTLSGELFAQGSFMSSNGHGSGRFRSMRGHPDDIKIGGGMDLASELDSLDVSETEVLEQASREALESEILKLQDTNKALTLYVNTIVVRLMSRGFEHVLAKDEKDVELPDGLGESFPVQGFREPAASTTGSLLSRTRSMLNRRTKSDMAAASALPSDNTPRAQRQNSLVASSASSVTSLTRTRHAESSPPPMHGTMSGKTGLRELASRAAADQKSQAEAKRLAEQFKPKTLTVDISNSVGHADSTKASPTNSKSSWFTGWRIPASPVVASAGAMETQQEKPKTVKRVVSELPPSMTMQPRGFPARPQSAKTK
jgi:hypothetical protein